MGDSQLLRIESNPVNAFGSRTLPIPMDVDAIPASRIALPSDKLDRRRGRIVDNKGNHITILETFKNLAPIMDAVLVDSDGTGQVSQPWQKFLWVH